MKPLVVFLSVIFILSSCSSPENDDMKEFIPGTYIRSGQNEFGKEYDTLVVSLQNKAGNEYKLQRRWRYDRVLDGKPIEPEYKLTETTGIYDAESKLLKETETLELMTFDKGKKLLLKGTNIFTKIK
jgi:hypothetical protein